VIPLVLATFSVSLEYVPELFGHIPFKYKVPDNIGYVFDTSYKDATWYFMQGLLGLISMISIFILINKKHIAARFLTLAPISWWIVEAYQKTCWLAKINDSRLYIDDSAIWQMSLIIFIVLGTIYGLIAFKS
jgi:hypothetical protein